MKIIKIIPISMIIMGILSTSVFAEADLTQTLKNEKAEMTISNNSAFTGADLTQALKNEKAETTISNTSSNSTSEGIVTPNPDSGYVRPKKNEVEDYFASIAVEKESVTELMKKIEGNKLLDAICNDQKALGSSWMEENRDTFAKMNIELFDGDNREGAQMTAKVSCDLINNTSTVIISSNNYVHTGISAACGIIKKDGTEIAFNLGEVKISLKGDISGQGEIGVVDLSLMQQQLVDEISLKDEFLNAADMDTNYKIDVIDMSMLQDYITKK